MYKECKVLPLGAPEERSALTPTLKAIKHRVVIECEEEIVENKKIPSLSDDEDCDNEEIVEERVTEDTSVEENSVEENDDPSSDLFSFMFCSAMHCTPPGGESGDHETQLDDFDDLPGITTFDDAMQPAGPRLLSWLDEVSPRQTRQQTKQQIITEQVTPISFQQATRGGGISSPSSTYGEIMHLSPQMSKQTSLSIWLAQRGLQSVEGKLAQLGITRLADLAYLTEDELSSLNLDPEKKLCFHLHLAT
uniref:SAM domain-containing protein n=1 Tax=Aureoumbra lagunensis TaxID=44058 RepID=A0A7S3NR98_9STRA|mmetsp:Transcript_636/g.812  ORF Transcript_636/g.812 Transcript_636/m.812 type:complete len:249 (+) Transcript_636:48-794(+)|eukprot:CAMPEP_0197291896 /NCGR_PEP_ID=MMETSP0890-20130614/19917_1 /TAXON_ID=44058 ORGANISM="Aureoumbra lagunensis, Strain CCMP1510" /NCGR_SAMPLE_ID=MMETSP0890 /ASSEMBLY_ACC=CAM_ASM_000533 /LENGTH=248 /DNA_ID=CAMNT_0042765365 /DNA_START=34 /DNA_END=780 /DNA_ORIENTATION=+